MDNETESKIVELQECIDEGHSFLIDREVWDYSGKACLVCSVCGYTKYVVVTTQEEKEYEKLDGDMDKFLKKITKG